MKNEIISILNSIGSGVLGILSIAEDLGTTIIDSLKKKRGFENKFGYESDISSRFNKGFVISKSRKLTRRKSFENLLLAGPTGSGKTQRILLKNLLEFKNASLIVNDPSKELFFLTSGSKSQFFKIITLNFSDYITSCGYNILSRIKKASDINKICDLLVRSTLEKSGNSDPFWSIAAKTLLAIFIRLVMHQSKEYQNMANVLYILKNFAAKPKLVDSWILMTKDEPLILEYKSMIVIPSKTLQSIVASAKASLQIFEDEEIAKVTSCDTIDFESLRKEPTIVFLHNSISDMKYINILNGIFFEQLYGHILQKLPEKNDLDLFIILEEASSLYIPILPVAIANTRKHRVGNLICVQSPKQLTTFYKDEADNIVSNCVTKIFLPGQTSIDVMRDLETYGGKSIHTDDKGIERIRPLITVDEIRMLDVNKSLILSSNNPLILGRTSPCYNSWKYKPLIDISSIPLQGDIPDGPVPLIGNEPIINQNDENKE